MLTNKTVVLGVTGSIAAYKMANVASMLVKLHADVHVIMTSNATNFINPITFETLTGNKCLTDTFDRNFQFNVEHVSLAKRADIFLVAPASANIIGKMACGIADDMLSTTLLAAKCPILVAPAMNTNMFTNSIVQDNIRKLHDYGMTIIEPATGYLACGDTGSGKLPDENILLEYILKEIAFPHDFDGKRILITAGPTQEAIDPVRFITNHSTGKMGYSIARIAMLRGAKVTLVSGPVSLTPPMFCNVINVTSASDMYDAVMQEAPNNDVIIKSAAVADYRPVNVATEKIKKSDNNDDNKIDLERTTDILATLGSNKKSGQILCGFSMETENMLANSRAKLLKKNADIIAANSLREDGAGFGVDTNVLTLITKDSEEALSLMSKEDAAGKLLDKILNLFNM
ncbi:MAG: bifunctional phosphopantothenoylcysteine decarboxylase/phosphopantothenate--cysteine ligase CoaBC [Lachnospiraceae bacterium]|nr:bifunctional phosphopantothenoylcysteine decarboxylase/phosphopantothenate--cysteine ligase CoaBC [Lachnospiraceae bacterium]